MTPPPAAPPAPRTNDTQLGVEEEGVPTPEGVPDAGGGARRRRGPTPEEVPTPEGAVSLVVGEPYLP